MKNLREQYLIETFPDASRQQKIQSIWKRQKRTDNIGLFIFMFGVCPAIGLLLVSLVVFYAEAIDSSPVTPVIMLAVASSALLFKRGLKGQVLRLWRYLKK